MLELEFLKKVDWQIVPEPSVLEAYYKSMIMQDPRYHIEPDINTSRPGIPPSGIVRTARSLPKSENERSQKALRTDVPMNE